MPKLRDFERSVYSDSQCARGGKGSSDTMYRRVSVFF